MRNVIKWVFLISLVLFCCEITYAQKKGKIKYDDGSVYVGEYIKEPTGESVNCIYFSVAKKQKLKHGYGILYQINGDTIACNWNNDIAIDGEYRFSNGNILNFKSGYEFGDLVFKEDGEIVINGEVWYYPENTIFSGYLDVNTMKPLRGKFNVPLVNASKVQFSGDFDESMMAGSLYFTESTKVNGWVIPANTTFKGNITTLSGSVDMIITNNEGNKYIGDLENGKPLKGKMIFADGHIEEGKWIKGMSPNAYKNYQEEQIKNRLEELDKILFEEKEMFIDKDIDIYFLQAIATKLYRKFKGKKLIIQEFSGKENPFYCKSVIIKNNHILMEGTMNGHNKSIIVSSVCYNSLPCEKDDNTAIKCKIPKAIEDKKYLYFITKKTGADPYTLGSNIQCFLESERIGMKNNVLKHYIAKYGNEIGRDVYNGKVKIGMTIEMVKDTEPLNFSEHREVYENVEIVTLSYGFLEQKRYTFKNNKLVNYSTGL